MIYLREMSNISNILVAPAGFKGLLTATEVAESIRDGLLEISPELKIDLLPMADGGAGTVDVLSRSLTGTIEVTAVTGPLGKSVSARYLRVDDGQTAIIEVASAAGYAMVSPSDQNPLCANTHGVGELIRDAIGKGCSKIVVGLGDSATIDCGIGMALALGYRFLDSKGRDVLAFPNNFSQIRLIDETYRMREIDDVEFIGFADVLNPVIGGEGAVRVFGPQKGVLGDMLNVLENGVERMIEIMESKFDMRLYNEPMTGAAGGLGAAVRAFLGGRLVRGAASVAKLIDLETAVCGADLVITGEGKMDEQSFGGKVASEVVVTAVNHEKPCVAVVGKADDEQLCRDRGFSKVIEISPNVVPSTKEDARHLIVEAVKEKLLSTILGS